MFFSRSTGGFYNTAIHGDNIPADAVEITDAHYASLMDAQTQGKSIQADSKGKPIAVDPPAPTAMQLTLAEIASLEASVTPRRIREAILGADNGWLAGVETQIAALRASLA